MHPTDIVLFSREGATRPTCVKNGVGLVTDDAFVRCDMYGNPRDTSEVFFRGWSPVLYRDPDNREEFQRYLELGHDTWRTILTVFEERDKCPAFDFNNQEDPLLFPWESEAGVYQTPGEMVIWVPRGVIG